MAGECQHPTSLKLRRNKFQRFTELSKNQVEVQCEALSMQRRFERFALAKVPKIVFDFFASFFYQEKNEEENFNDLYYFGSILFSLRLRSD